MGKADVVVNMYFLQYGNKAPKNSNFEGVLGTDSLFGNFGWSSYTSREKATEDSINTNKEEGSFADYTSRESATDGSSESSYFTMTNSGKIFNESERNEWIKEARKSFSTTGDIAWEFTVSLESYDVLDQLMIRDQEDMARITNVALTKIFKRMKMDPENMIWWEDYHTNTDHPHMHITFLEKENSRTRGKFTANELKAAKRIFINELGACKRFAEQNLEDYENVLKETDEIKRTIISETKELDYSTFTDIINLFAQLPERGRLQYNSVYMNPFRDQLDEITDRILKTDGIAEEYKSFSEKLDSLAQVMDRMGNEKISTIREREDKKLRIQISNSVLTIYKNLDGKTKEKMRKTKAWKEKACSEYLSNLSFDKLDEMIKDPIMKEAYQALFEGNIEKGMLILENLDSSPDAKFLGAAFQFLKGNTDVAAALMSSAARNGHKAAKKVDAIYKMKVGNNIRPYKGMKKKFMPSLRAAVTQSISEQKKEIDKEIAAYLNNKNGAVTIDSSYELDRYLRGQ